MTIFVPQASLRREKFGRLPPRITSPDVFFLDEVPTSSDTIRHSKNVQLRGWDPEESEVRLIAGLHELAQERRKRAAGESGFKSEIRAIPSALTNSDTRYQSRKIRGAAVVLPDPLGPASTTTRGFLSANPHDTRQNRSFNASRICRSPLDDEIMPSDELPVVAEGLAKIGVFVRPMASARNCRLNLSA